MLSHLHITIQLRCPEWPPVVSPQGQSKENAWDVPISFSISSTEHHAWHIVGASRLWSGAGAASEGDWVWEKADVRESKQKARVSILLFLQIDVGILETAEHSNPLAYAYSVISTYFSGQLETCLTPHRALQFSPLEVTSQRSVWVNWTRCAALSVWSMPLFNFVGDRRRL